ncbi:MAG TPA: YfiR family protein [Candidatus Dormibacteraeota bacterium]|nr:YfiR family protein [Candidatus Dormibacteraeota bacterium]
MGAQEEVSRGPSGGRVNLLATVLLAVCTACAFPGDVFSQAISHEYQLKAIYLGKLPSFVEWPASAASTSKALFQLCTLGDYPFGSRLAQEVGGVSFAGRDVALRWVHKEQELEGCEVIFFSRSQAKHYGKILEGLKGKSVLTVGESEGFLEAGGMVEFSFESDRLQMKVNLVAARNANLKMDARLLALAKRVVTEHSIPGG